MDVCNSNSTIHSGANEGNIQSKSKRRLPGRPRLTDEEKKERLTEKANRHENRQRELSRTVFCDVCKTTMQARTYDTSHKFSKKHIALSSEGEI
jgi:hypothetical protein